jgi:hypothetical protein
VKRAGTSVGTYGPASVHTSLSNAAPEWQAGS